MQCQAAAQGVRSLEDLARSHYPDQLEELIRRVHTYNPAADEAFVRHAYDYSARMHATQKRKSGEPYVIHPLNVALIATQLKLDSPSIVAALLHDVVEDTAASPAEVTAQFGADVAHLVEGLTKVSKITYSSREEKQAENFRKIVIAMAQDIRVVLVKLADRLHNMRTLDHLDAGRQREIARETLEIYAPIAHRLGIYWLKSELEDLAFRYLNSAAYQQIGAFVAEARDEREAYIRGVIEILTKRLADEGIVAEVTGRPKHFYSIHEKMQSEALEFDQIYDLVAFRIIVGNVRQCYDALGVVHANWKPVPGRFKDYIALPKPNEYQSLHTTVIGPLGRRMEVQIRTREMHRVAEEGIAAHWNYKEGDGEAPRETQRFAWLRRLTEWQQSLADPQEFISTVKDDLFPEEVFVFTPKGDVFNFPPGSTIVDFAYRIHSEVGNHLIGARVNGRMVPIRYQLKSGDAVEVITSEKQSPGKDWLNFAATARAKGRIRQWLRAREADRAIRIANSLLDDALEPLGLSVGQLRRDNRFEPALKEFSHKDLDSLLAALGYGFITVGPVLGKVLKPEELKLFRAEKAPAPADKERPLREDRGARADRAGGVVVSGLNDVLVRFAKCCNPLPGEPITGFITRGRGVTVHIASCPAALEADPQRRVPVVWKAGEDSPRPIRLEVECIDQPGLLAAMSKAIAAAGINISTAQTTTDIDGRAHSIFEVSVTSASQLNNLMHSLAGIDGVRRVLRLGYRNAHRAV